MLTPDVGIVISCQASPDETAAMEYQEDKVAEYKSVEAEE